MFIPITQTTNAAPVRTKREARIKEKKMYEVYFYIKEYHDHMRLCVHEQTFGACFDTIDEIKTWARENLSFPDRITKITDLRTGKDIPMNAIE